MDDHTPRAEQLRAVRDRVLACTRCPELVRTRTQVVAGTAAERAEVVLVGEAPGPLEDQRGVPQAGRAGALLAQVLAEAGLGPDRVLSTHAVRCLPPAGRAPRPPEVTSCAGWLEEQLALLRPTVVCALGAAAARLLRGEPGGIGELRGRPEVREVAGRLVHLLVLLHPAAALYNPEGAAQLREDVARIPALLALGPPQAPPPVATEAAAPEEPVAAGPGQLELF